MRSEACLQQPSRKHYTACPRATYPHAQTTEIGVPRHMKSVLANFAETPSSGNTHAGTSGITTQMLTIRAMGAPPSQRLHKRDNARAACQSRSREGRSV